VDKDGNAYLAGETTSIDFPVVGTPLHTPKFALTYGFVTKVNAAGNKIVYSSYMGGGSTTRNLAIQVDGEGNAYLGGVTGARDFPLANPTQNTQPGLNIGFVTKLNATGDKLLFSTYIGGERNDRVDVLALDAQGSIYVTGYATSTTLPMVNAFQSKIGGSSDALVAKWAAPDYRLAYCSYLGGAGAEDAFGIAVDSSGAAYLTGYTVSPNMATPNVYQSKMLGSGEGYVARVAPNGSLGFFTYLGGAGDDHIQAIAVDRSGNIVITGFYRFEELSRHRQRDPKAAEGPRGCFRHKDGCCRNQGALLHLFGRFADGGAVVPGRGPRNRGGSAGQHRCEWRDELLRFSECSRSAVLRRQHGRFF